MFSLLTILTAIFSVAHAVVSGAGSLFSYRQELPRGPLSLGDVDGNGDNVR